MIVPVRKPTQTLATTIGDMCINFVWYGNITTNYAAYKYVAAFNVQMNKSDPWAQKKTTGSQSR